jgi:hypothetical protein
MKRVYKITVFAIVIGFASVTLTSGVSKRDNGGGRDLVEELYEQAVKQNDNLESIEEGIDNFYKKKEDAIEKYNSFSTYNNRYYADARSKSGMIADAATKQRAFDIINISETAYKVKIADWQNTIAVLNANERELNDLYTLLKIMITEPVIAKFQATGFPDNGKLKEANVDLLKVMEKIKTITR